MREHKQKLIEVIIDEQNEDRGGIYPKVLLYTHSDLSELFLHAKNSAKYTFLFLQEPSDIIGPEITIDLHRVKEVVVRYTSKNNTDLVKLLEAGGEFPSLFAVDRELKFQKIEPLSPTREAFRSAIRLFLEPQQIRVPEIQRNDVFSGKWRQNDVLDMASFMHERERKALKERVKKMGDVVFQMDLETVLR